MASTVDVSVSELVEASRAVGCHGGDATLADRRSAAAQTSGGVAIVISGMLVVHKTRLATSAPIGPLCGSYANSYSL
jgi:hypothetical protein